LISRPTTKKNTAIRPCFTQSANDRVSAKPPICTVTGAARSRKYKPSPGEFATATAAAAAAARIRPEALSVFRKSSVIRLAIRLG
jgi:hypothetical protein